MPISCHFRGCKAPLSRIVSGAIIKWATFTFFLFVWYSNFVPKKCGFWDIRLQKMSWLWNPGQRSLKVIGTDTDRSATYDFLWMLHSNHEPISYRFQDKRRFQSKIANFPTSRVFNAPLKGFPLKLATDARDQKTRMMAIPDGQNSFKIR